MQDVRTSSQVSGLQRNYQVTGAEEDVSARMVAFHSKLIAFDWNATWTGNENDRQRWSDQLEELRDEAIRIGPEAVDLYYFFYNGDLDDMLFI